jgi:general secretion pathway protein I
LRAGFTLLEVMVALIIVALAIPALLGRMGAMSNNVAYTRELTMAHWVAENKIQELRLNEKLQRELPSGLQAGDIEMGGIRWDWQVETEEQKDLYEGSLKVTIRVSPQGKPPIVELITVMVKPG